MKKLVLPKFKIRLKIILYLLLGFVLVSELLVVYKVYILSESETFGKTEILAPAAQPRLNQKELEDARAWFEKRDEPTPLPQYIFPQEPFGRRNPLAEY